MTNSKRYIRCREIYLHMCYQLWYIGTGRFMTIDFSCKLNSTTTELMKMSHEKATTPFECYCDLVATGIKTTKCSLHVSIFTTGCAFHRALLCDQCMQSWEKAVTYVKKYYVPSDLAWPTIVVTACEHAQEACNTIYSVSISNICLTIRVWCMPSRTMTITC